MRGIKKQVSNLTDVNDKQEEKLLAAYEAIRRREYELINELLEILPKIDTLDEDKLAQVRDALFHADHPFLVVFVGPFSSGKSSLINALMGSKDLLAVGPVPTTDRISILRYGDDAQRMNSGGEVDTVFYPSPLLKKVSFVDTPGLESVFQKHEETTRKFLHRSDVVILTMLATQAMTQRNLDYMQQLREYGKKLIIVVNQADLLSAEEREQVRNYVLEQSEDKLNFKPEVWMVSAKQGLQARTNGEITDEALWQASGLHRFEQYIDEQLDDVQRLRQKLQTPLQIAQNVHRIAADAVKANQAVLDQYQGIADNVNSQLQAYRREQEKIVRETNEQIAEKFNEAARRGGEAIRDIFQLGRSLGSLRIGLFDLIGLSRIFQRGKPTSYARLAFERAKVYEPINELPTIADKLGPALEGKDLQDTDDLVKYAQKEINALPETIRGKIIGDIKPPVKYDRTALQAVRPELEQIETEARITETEQIERRLRSVLFGLALWEVLIFVGVIALLLTGFDIGIFLLLLLLAMLGLLAMPVAGRILEINYRNRMNTLQQRYIEALSKGSDKQVEYGMTLRRDVVAPLTRLVEAQTQLQTEQMNQLQKIEREMIQVESDLTKLGKKRGIFSR